ncbi:LytTR family transcriptional regulator DNA-binding domain-containing protein [Dysgonomonas sp. GY75]|uniref:LytTR family transcriptional regulator DNA-binding domain-containing protein n=1 Tax=Dysgonomonas sp. GY75 TaxID=2780419 RepID=UPI001883C77E|nr:LytTR family DNA-binding domain-containing protein [Dysgonomonas sp. GY75]MBF0650112.1 LytTR family transcriptional regulator DNA-binding domain-containing protein [Dysgonomonas sp. GY75]
MGNIQRKIVPVIADNTTNAKVLSYQESFLTQQKEKSLIVYTKDIALFAIEFETIYMYTFEGKKFSVFKNMDYIESVCDPRLFFRINRQMLVHRNNILSIEPYFNRKVVLHLNVNAEEKAVVSRLSVTPLKKWIEKGNAIGD